MRIFLVCFPFFMTPAVSWAESLVATRTIRSNTTLVATDLTVINETMPGALQSPNAAIGLETRIVLFAGRPVYPSDLGPAALVERNDIVALVFMGNGLKIATEARAMERGGLGDIIRVMNLSSRTTVSGEVLANGSVSAGGDFR